MHGPPGDGHDDDNKARRGGVVQRGVLRVRIWAIHNMTPLFYLGAAVVAALMCWRSLRKHASHRHEVRELPGFE